MSIQEIFILGIALALDALIVSFSYGLMLSDKFKNALKLGLFFGFFQFLMPILGWYFTGVIYGMLYKYSKWIVFFIFMYLGVKFLFDAFNEKENEKKYIDCISLLCLISLSFATSIDAFAAGISLKFININIYYVSVLIGIITLVLSVTGFFSSLLLKKINPVYLEFAGAFMFIFLAIKSLI